MLPVFAQLFSKVCLPAADVCARCLLRNMKNSSIFLLDLAPCIFTMRFLGLSSVGFGRSATKCAFFSLVPCVNNALVRCPFLGSCHFIHWISQNFASTAFARFDEFELIWSCVKLLRGQIHSSTTHDTRNQRHTAPN